MHQLNVSKKGIITVLTWERKDPEDVRRAREFFMKLTKQGWFAAAHNRELRRVLEFSPEYQELWFIPVIEGG